MIEMESLESDPIIIPNRGAPVSPGRRFFQFLSAQTNGFSESSDLLKSIKAALRGSGEELDEPIQTSLFSAEELGIEEELAWDQHTVVLSSGGNQKCKWNLEEEGQCIQWACVGWLLRPGVMHGGSINSAARYTSSKENESLSLSSTKERDTFSPFTRARQARQKINEPSTVARAVFVFLRSFGKVYLSEGIEHTFSLPFIVRKAWPLYPHGVLLQRVLDRAEMEEAEITGDFTLPTLFTITNPFSEPRAVGISEGIKGGFGSYKTLLKDGDASHTKPLKSIPADEHVIYVSERLSGAADDLIVTINADRQQISVWHYAYTTPKDIPISLGHRRARSLSRRRTSMSGITSSEHRQTGLSQTLSDRAERIAPLSPDPLDTPRLDLSEFPPLSAIPGLPISMTTTTTTLSSLSTAASLSSQWTANSSGRGRRNSLTRNELSVTMDRMALGKKPESNISLATIEHGRMTPAFWAEKLYHYELSEIEQKGWRNVHVSCFDQRYDGETDRTYVSICLPSSQKLLILKLTREKDTTQTLSFLTELSAVSATAIRATRNIAWDLLVAKPDGSLALLMHGLYELPLQVACKKAVDSDQMQVDGEMTSRKLKALSIRDAILNSVTIGFEDGSEIRTTVSLFPPDILTNCCLCALGATLPPDIFFLLHKKFLQLWSKRNLDSAHFVEFDCFEEALADTLQIDGYVESDASTRSVLPWEKLQQSRSYSRLRDDTALFNLKLPSLPRRRLQRKKSPHQKLFTPILLALHTLAENLRLQLHFHKDLLRLIPILCRIAGRIRPGWAEYWHRLCPEVDASWRANPPEKEDIDEVLSFWPPDMAASLIMKLGHPELPRHMTDLLNIGPPYNRPPYNNAKPSFAFGRTDPLACLHEVSGVYNDLANPLIGEARKRSENAVVHMIRFHRTYGQLSLLAMGIASPLREAARTCQLYPPPEWPLAAYEFIGRNDLSEGAVAMNDQIFNDGYASVKEHITKRGLRKSYKMVFDETHKAVHGDHEAVTGVELDLENFTDIRFGQDRRLYEVARILCSASVTSVKTIERPELNEHDIAKEHQAHVIRTAERTLSLPLGRAIFTYGSLPSVSREVYAIPKIDLSIRLQPQNIVISPELGKISAESMNWADFHNGVAAGLRISPSTKSIDSSWITFNKPQELNPEHAGFLYGLGLNGHLKEMLTWHTFSYLTPKHDLTSIGVLLGLSAANVGTGNRHVTKLIAVHTPALLPTPAVDLNVPLLTQAAGLVGIGLLYMGTKNRRMAEMALHQISRRDLLQPDLSNEHREAYTLAAALSFGMVMLGKGATVSSPVDLALLSRLRILIHGEGPSTTRGSRGASFDINLTSPAASIALGLMYLRTERADIADILSIPNTVLALNHVQPSFLLIRTLARALILWERIKPTVEWLVSQIPSTITQSMEARQRGQPVDDAIELAYYHIVSGACMAVGLKYAGTASHDAYMFIINSYDLFSRYAHVPGPAFDQKIKRSAVRDGLNTISLSLNMVMAGTAEINCLRRLRYAHGMNGPIRYGSHMATHMSLGLLFLGVGRYTLGTSDAAIACMITAFYPRFPNLSSDNKCYLQALRHLWVLAVEPRCLVARDVDTKEIVYLPMKIRVKEDNAGSSGTQLISPSLIPGLDRLAAIKVDTPRYWPFYLDIANIPRHREALLRSQTLLVKRHCAFLSYLEDPKGSRSLFVRSGSSTSNAAGLDFPQSTTTRAHPAGDLQDFITSASNDTLFMAFADRFCREYGETEDEKIFHSFCHAALSDSILQGKPQTLQTYLLLHRARVMSPKSRYFNLMLQDLRFMADFYNKVYERRMSGRWDNPNGGGVLRPPLVRESTVLAVLHSIDEKLNNVRNKEGFKKALKDYILKREITDEKFGEGTTRELAWYLMRENVPDGEWLESVLALGRRAWKRSLDTPPPGGVQGLAREHRDILKQSIRMLMQTTGSGQAVFHVGSGWSVKSFEEILGILRGASAEGESGGAEGLDMGLDVFGYGDDWDSSVSTSTSGISEDTSRSEDTSQEEGDEMSDD